MFDLKKLKSVSDNGDHYVVHHADHGVFPVAKKGIDDATHKRIQALAKGGEVNGYSGDDVAPADQVVAPDNSWENDTLLGRIGSGVRGAAKSIGLWPGQSPDDLRMAASRKGTVLMNAVEDTPPTATDASAPRGTLADASAPDVIPPSIAAPTTPVAQAKAPDAGEPRIPSFDKGFGRGVGEQRNAIEAQEKIGQDMAKDVADITQNAMKAKQTALDQLDNDYKDAVSKGKDVAQKIASSQLDPERYWTNKSTGQKMMAGIGMILSGIGSGLTGGPNQALALIQRAMEADVDAQKSNLNSLNNQVRYYAEKGHSIQVAKQLTMANHADALSGQIALVATKYGGQKVAAEALQAKGLLDQAASQGYRQGFDATQAETVRGLDILEKKTQFAYQKRVMEAMGKLQGGTLAGPEQGMLPADVQKTIVNVPGEVVVGHDKNGEPMTAIQTTPRRMLEGSKPDELRNAFVENGETLGMLNTLENFQKKHAAGTLLPSEAKEVSGVVAKLKLDASKRFSPEVGKMLSDMFPNPADVTSALSGAAKSAIQSMKHMTLSKQHMLEAANLVPLK